MKITPDELRRILEEDERRHPSDMRDAVAMFIVCFGLLALSWVLWGRS